jgi:hypothetical protein
VTPCTKDVSTNATKVLYPRLNPQTHYKYLILSGLQPDLDIIYGRLPGHLFRAMCKSFHLRCGILYYLIHGALLPPSQPPTAKAVQMKDQEIGAGLSARAPWLHRWITSYRVVNDMRPTRGEEHHPRSWVNPFSSYPRPRGTCRRSCRAWGAQYCPRDA